MSNGPEGWWQEWSHNPDVPVRPLPWYDGAAWPLTGKYYDHAWATCLAFVVYPVKDYRK